MRCEVGRREATYWARLIIACTMAIFVCLCLALRDVASLAHSWKMTRVMALSECETSARPALASWLSWHVWSHHLEKLMTKHERSYAWRASTS